MSIGNPTAGGGKSMNPIMMGNTMGSTTAPNQSKLQPPREMVCTNEQCFQVEQPKQIHKKFCSDCGEKLEERIGEMYVDLIYGTTPSDRFLTPDDKPIIEDKKLRVSMRDLVRFMKEYEKELFIEEI